VSLFERVVPSDARLLHEGIFDPHILKAIFLGGGMGSGKSWTAGTMFGKLGSQLGGAFGLKTLSVDEIYAWRVKQKGLDLKTAFEVPTDNPKFPSIGKELHDRSWYTMMNQRAHFARGRLGVIVDGTAKNPTYILKGKKALEDLGYDCSMVMVVTPIEVARERNQARGRTVPDADVVASHQAVAKAGQTYKKKFGHRYYEIENKGTYDTGSAEFRTEIEPKMHRMASKILAKPLENPKGKAWVEGQLAGAPEHLKRKVYSGLGIRPKKRKRRKLKTR